MTIKELIENGKGYLELNENKIDLANPQFKDLMRWNENIANGEVRDGVAYDKCGTKLAWNWVSLEETSEAGLNEVAEEIINEEEKEDELIEKFVEEIVEEEVDKMEDVIEEIAEEIVEEETAEVVEDISTEHKGKDKTK